MSWFTDVLNEFRRQDIEISDDGQFADLIVKPVAKLLEKYNDDYTQILSILNGTSGQSFLGMVARAKGIKSTDDFFYSKGFFRITFDPGYFLANPNYVLQIKAGDIVVTKNGNYVCSESFSFNKSFIDSNLYSASIRMVAENQGPSYQLGTNDVVSFQAAYQGISKLTNEPTTVVGQLLTEADLETLIDLTLSSRNYASNDGTNYRVNQISPGAEVKIVDHNDPLMSRGKFRQSIIREPIDFRFSGDGRASSGRIFGYIGSRSLHVIGTSQLDNMAAVEEEIATSDYIDLYEGSGVKFTTNPDISFLVDTVDNVLGDGWYYGADGDPMVAPGQPVPTGTAPIANPASSSKGVKIIGAGVATSQASSVIKRRMPFHESFKAVYPVTVTSAGTTSPVVGVDKCDVAFGVFESDTYEVAGVLSALTVRLSFNLNHSSNAVTVIGLYDGNVLLKKFPITKAGLARLALNTKYSLTIDCSIISASSDPNSPLRSRALGPVSIRVSLKEFVSGDDVIDVSSEYQYQYHYPANMLSAVASGEENPRFAMTFELHDNMVTSDLGYDATEILSTTAGFALYGETIYGNRKLVANDVVLVNFQNSKLKRVNGLYIVNALGNWTRATNANSYSELSGKKIGISSLSSNPGVWAFNAITALATPTIFVDWFSQSAIPGLIVVPGTTDIDGIPVKVGDRILIAYSGAINSSDQGVFVVGNNGALTRPSDCDSIQDFNGVKIAVCKGDDFVGLYSQTTPIGSSFSDTVLAFSDISLNPGVSELTATKYDVTFNMEVAGFEFKGAYLESFPYVHFKFNIPYDVLKLIKYQNYYSGDAIVNKPLLSFILGTNDIATNAMKPSLYIYNRGLAQWDKLDIGLSDVLSSTAQALSYKVGVPIEPRYLYDNSPYLDFMLTYDGDVASDATYQKELTVYKPEIISPYYEGHLFGLRDVFVKTRSFIQEYALNSALTQVPVEFISGTQQYVRISGQALADPENVVMRNGAVPVQYAAVVNEAPDHMFSPKDSYLYVLKNNGGASDMVVYADTLDQIKIIYEDATNNGVSKSGVDVLIRGFRPVYLRMSLILKQNITLTDAVRAEIYTDIVNYVAVNVRLSLYDISSFFESRGVGRLMIGNNEFESSQLFSYIEVSYYDITGKKIRKSEFSSVTLPNELYRYFVSSRVAPGSTVSYSDSIRIIKG